jgi:hypothetical protein
MVFVRVFMFCVTVSLVYQGLHGLCQGLNDLSGSYWSIRFLLVCCRLGPLKMQHAALINILLITLHVLKPGNETSVPLQLIAQSLRAVLWQHMVHIILLQSPPIARFEQRTKPAAQETNPRVLLQLHPPNRRSTSTQIE